MFMKKPAYLITNIQEYGKFISYCIENDISVWRTYWDEREKENRCYHINWEKEICYYATKQYYKENNIEVVVPIFYLDEYGNYKIQ